MFDTRLILKNSIESIQKLLCAALFVQHLDVIDESSKHARHMEMKGLTESLTHICIRIKAPELDGLSRIEQHRRLYAVLQPAIDSGLHSIRFQIL